MSTPLPYAGIIRFKSKGLGFRQSQLTRSTPSGGYYEVGLTKYKHINGIRSNN